MSAPKLVDLKPKFGGASSDHFIALVVEKAQNGWILKEMVPSDEDHLIEQTFIYSDRAELLRDIARKI